MKSRRDQMQVYQRVKDGLRRGQAKTTSCHLTAGPDGNDRQRHSESVRSRV